MGSAGTFSPGVHELPDHTGFSLTWTDGTSLLGVRSFVVDFEGTGASTPLVDSKDVDPAHPARQQPLNGFTAPG